MVELTPRQLAKIFLAAAFFALTLNAASLQAAYRMDVRPGYGVSALKWLSDYNPNLKGTDYDTPLYVMEGKPGAALLILGGTHPREIAGPMTAAVVLENAQVEQGRLFIVPCLNAAGMSVPDQLGQVPNQLAFEGRTGRRWLNYGDRRIPLRKGESDPKEFVHPSGYVHKDGAEWRNLNRNYPGIADGTPAQRVCYAVMELIRREKVQTCMDIHEATAPEEVCDAKTGKMMPGGTLSYSLITNPKYIDPCIEMVFTLGDRGINLKPEVSIPGFRGISHYEIGNETSCIPFLSETPNPAMNEYAVKPDPLHDAKHPIEERVGITLEILQVWFESCKDLVGSPFVLKGSPSKAQLEKDGLGAWLQ